MKQFAFYFIYSFLFSFSLLSQNQPSSTLKKDQIVANRKINFGKKSNIRTVSSTTKKQGKVSAISQSENTTSINSKPLLKPVPNICVGGLDQNALYFEDFEDGLAGWVTENTGGTEWVSQDWVSVADPGNGRNSTVAFAINTENCDNPNAYGLMSLTSPQINIPNTVSGSFYLAFDHYIATEFRWDGGNLKYKIGAGSFQIVPALAFEFNGYNSTLNTNIDGNSNPLAGEAAFTGADEGLTTGTWGQSRINLSTLGVQGGETIQFRWDLGQDNCIGWEGWYIDDVKLYSCNSIAGVSFTTTNSTVSENEANIVNSNPNQCLPYIEKTVSVKINKTPSQPAILTFNNISGTASMGNTLDYTIYPNSVTLQDGNLLENITLRIYNDAYVEGNETILLNYTLDANGGDAVVESNNQTHEVTIIDNDNLTGSNTIEFINENFENGLPNWPIFENDGTSIDPEAGIYPNSWAVKSEAGLLDPTGSNALIADSDAYGDGPWNKIIETPTFNTLGLSEIKVDFIEYFRTYNEVGDLVDETGIVEVWDGAAWQNILTHIEADGDIGSLASPAQQSINIPISFANSAMKIRFKYNANWDFYWIIDNVKITGKSETGIQTAINTSNPSQEYLGPNATAVFYDPITGNAIAKIKNLTNHDYGCTTVEIDRAGNGATSWIHGYQITQKTIKVTPTFNNTNGQYEITLYYTVDDLGGFVGSIQSMGKSIGSIIASISGQYGQVSSNNAYGSDYAFTSTFESGFSGFGLSNAPYGIPLSVRLLNFLGKPTSNGNQLNWTTSSEINNAHFVVERSADGKIFSEIGIVKGNNNTSEIKRYAFLDENPITKISYYRIKDVDLNGKTGISQAIAIKSTDLNGLAFWPNPTKNFLNINLEDGNHYIDLKIFNSTGIQVDSRKEFTNDGNFKIDLTKLPTGIYEAVIEDESGLSRVKFSKD